MKNFIISFILLSLSEVSVPAQQDSAYRAIDVKHSKISQQDSIIHLETDSFELFYSKDQISIDSSKGQLPSTVETSLLSNATYVKFSNDTSLIIRKGSKMIPLNVKDIVSVKFYYGNMILEGMLSGALAGFALALAVADTNLSLRSLIATVAVGIVVAIPLAVIGGIIGIFFKDEHTYDLAGLSNEEKKTKLLKIFKKHRK